MLSGDNGILQRATDAKTGTTVGQEKEIIALAYNSALAKKVSNGSSSAVTDSELNDELDNSEATASGNPIIVTFTKTGNAYEIDSQGVIKPSTPKDPSAILKVADHKNEKFATNTELEDSFGNKIIVPAGFKITNDSPSSVTGGIIIEDVDAGTETTAGSQFVWIATGDVYTDINGTKKNITLGRYVFDDSGNIDTTLSKTEPLDQLKTSSSDSNYYTEGLQNSTTQNAHAKNIEEFITKANSKKGYYIGRYEARVEEGTLDLTSWDDEEGAFSNANCTGYTNGKLVEKGNAQVFNYTTQNKASELSKSMYSTNSDFESDLINSYAWDTATLFLQEFGEANYSIKSSVNSSFANKGTSATDYTGTKDVVCNVYDMASNCFEFTTETSSRTIAPCVLRGCVCGSSSYWTNFRNNFYSTYNADERASFRPILYVK